MTHAFYAGIISSGTFVPSLANGGVQKCTNGGAHRLAPPEEDGEMVLCYVNGTDAGPVALDSFSDVLGDELTTTAGDMFMFNIRKYGSYSELLVAACQDAPRPGVGKVTIHNAGEPPPIRWPSVRVLSHQDEMRAKTAAVIWQELSRMVELDRGLTSNRTLEMLLTVLQKHDGDAP